MDPEGLHDQPSEIRIRRRDEVDPARQDRRRPRQIHLGSENLSDVAASHSDEGGSRKQGGANVKIIFSSHQRRQQKQKS